MDKYKVGYATGVFDLFHIGHLNLLRSAKQITDKLIVGVSTDQLVHSYKDKYPVIPFRERIEIVKSIKYVDQVVPQDNLDKVLAFQTIGFDALIVGDDWKGTSRWDEYENRFAELGVAIEYLPYTNTTSSTLLRKVITNLSENSETPQKPWV